MNSFNWVDLISLYFTLGSVFYLFVFISFLISQHQKTFSIFNPGDLIFFLGLVELMIFWLPYLLIGQAKITLRPSPNGHYVGFHYQSLLFGTRF